MRRRHRVVVRPGVVVRVGRREARDLAVRSARIELGVVEPADGERGDVGAARPLDDRGAVGRGYADVADRPLVRPVVPVHGRVDWHVAISSTLLMDVAGAEGQAPVGSRLEGSPARDSPWC